MLLTTHLLDENADPLVFRAADIEVTTTISDIPDFLVFVDVLVKKHLHFIFVDRPHRLGRYRHFIAILISSRRCELVHPINIFDMVIFNAKLSERLLFYLTPRIVGESRITLSRLGS